MEDKEISDNQEFNKKRTSNHDFKIPRSTFSNLQAEKDNDSLSLSLSLRPPRPPRRPRLLSSTHQQQQHLPFPPPPPTSLSERLQALLSHPPPQPSLQLPALRPMFMSPPLLPRPVSDPSLSTSAVHRPEVGASRPPRVPRNPRQAPPHHLPLPMPSPAQQLQQLLPLPPIPSLLEQLPPSLSEQLQALLSHPPPRLPLELPALHRMFMLPPLLPRPVSDPSSSTPPVRHPEVGASRPMRLRRDHRQAPQEGKSAIVPAPFPWATTYRATVHSLNYLLSKQIFSITGQVQCKRCEHRYGMDFDLRSKFVEVGTFIAENKSTMHDRAPAVWMSPVLPTCRFCSQENSVTPIISDKKKMINWLFLLLGQMLVCCTLGQLKYFCKHTKNHRTGTKDRLLYLTYLGLCKQLDPNGPFDC